MKAVTTARLIGRDGPRVHFAGDYDTSITVTVLEPAIIRVTVLRKEGWKLDRTWSLAPGGMEPPFEGRARDDLTGFSCPDFEMRDEDGRIVIATEALTAVVRLSPFGIDWHEAGSSTAFAQDRPTQAYMVSRKTGQIAHFMARNPAESHHGLGDKAGPYDRTGRRYRLDAVDPCGFDAETSDPLYKIIPFYIVDRDGGPSYGLFYDNLATGEVDFGATIDNYHGLFRCYRADDGDLDYYFIAGPAMRDVVARYTWLTGGQHFPPQWSLGFGITSMSIADAPDADARVTAFIEDCRRHAIPCDSFHFGSGYSSIGARRYCFNWNHDKFPDPAATMKRLNDAGMRPVANLKPCLLDDHPKLADAMDKGILVKDASTGAPALAQFWDGLGFHLDFTNPAGIDWWRNGLKTTLLDFGIVTAWNDNNEFEIWDEDAICHGFGRPFPQPLARPIQAQLMSKLSRETQIAQRPMERPYVISRAGGPGIGRYGQTWSGDNSTDWKTLRWNLRQGLGMSLSGLFNIGHDVGGFHGPTPEPELLCRFIEFCALWPRFVMNSWKSSGIVTLPWMYPDLLPTVREAYTLRYRLMPHIYAAMRRAAVSHVPPLRPLGMDFPHDSKARREQDSFLLGEGLLVAPVLDKGTVTRNVYLPEHPHGWYDFHSAQWFAGGQEIAMEAPLGRIPLLAAGGSMIALSEQIDRVDPQRDAVRRLRVFAHRQQATSSAELYDDDGVTPDWNLGAGRLLGVKLTTDARGQSQLSPTSVGSYRPLYDRIAVEAVGGELSIEAGSEQWLTLDASARRT
jgi:alpha-glucosidase